MSAATPHPMGLTAQEPGSSTKRIRLRATIDRAAHLLPQQSPLHMFVHHNTLHAFEDLHFEQAVLEGAARFGTEPYQSETCVCSMLGDREDSTVRHRSGSSHNRRISPTCPSCLEVRRDGSFTRCDFVIYSKFPEERPFNGCSRRPERCSDFIRAFPASARAAILQSAERISIDPGPMTPTAREEQALERLWKELLAVAPTTIPPRGRVAAS